MLAAIKGNIGTKVIFRVGGDDAHRLQRTVEVTNAKELATQADYEFMLQYKAGSKVVTRRGRSILAPYVHHGKSSKIINWTNATYARPMSELTEQYERWLASSHFDGTPNCMVKGQVANKKSNKIRSVGAVMLERYQTKNQAQL